MKFSHYVEKAERGLLFALFFLFPIIFLPFFPDIFGTAKLFILVLVFSILLILKAIKVFASKKIELYTSSFGTYLYLLAVSYLLSIVISSPNRIEALIDPERGALMVILLVSLVFLLPKDKLTVLYAGIASQLVIFIALFLSYFSLLKFLPESLGFVNNKAFTLTGGMLATVLYSAFFTGVALDALKKKLLKRWWWQNHKHDESEYALGYALLAVAAPTLILSLFILFNDVHPYFVPLSIAWQVAVEGLKNIKEALFGVGPANYLALYTRGKPLFVNSINELWQANLNFSQSAGLHIFSEIGLFGFVAVCLLLIRLTHLARKFGMLIGFTVLLVWFAIFPVSYNFYFLFFTIIMLFWEEKKVRTIDLADLGGVIYTICVFLIALVGLTGYFMYRVFASEYYLAQSLTSAHQNKGQEVYELQRRAAVENPYSEKARFNFAQTNIVLANNIAQKKEIKDADKQTIATLIQQGIAEMKATVALNDQKAIYWASLAQVYRRIIGVAENASAFTLSAYQHAIALDKNNPIYFFESGSVQYSLGNYDAAIQFFGQAIVLRGNMPNFHYNLAFAYYQKKDYKNAVTAMETALALLSDKKSEDYKKAQKDLAEFRALLPEEDVAPEDATLKPETLTQPSPIPSSAVSPIQLPKSSAPSEN